MADLKSCKTCKKDVADRVRKCPHCGQANPTITKKDARDGCLGVIVISVIAAITLSLCSDNVDTEAYKELQNATQAEWLAAPLKKRQSAAEYWAWVLLEKPGSEHKSTVQKAGTQIRECLDEIDVPNIEMKAASNAAVCWTIISAK